MFLARSQSDLQKIRSSVARIRSLSDRVVGVGPLGIGMDGLLSWIPGAGVLYSAGAGAILVAQGARARLPGGKLALMSAILAFDTLLDVLPNPVTAVIDTFFTGHKWSANILLGHMDRTIYIEGSQQDAQAKPEYAELLARIRTGAETRRIVFLG
jgi:hypothetical protein